MWGARCKGEIWQLLATGRWQEASKHFYTYIKSGTSTAERYEDPTQDPIRQIWAYHPNVMTTLQAKKDTLRDISECRSLDMTTDPSNDEDQVNICTIPLHSKMAEESGVEYLSKQMQDLVGPDRRGTGQRSVEIEWYIGGRGKAHSKSVEMVGLRRRLIVVPGDWHINNATAVYQEPIRASS